MFGENLRAIRKSKHITLEQLAEMYNSRFGGGMSKGTLSKYENNKQEPMMTTANNIAEILNVSTDELLGTNKHLTLSDDDIKIALFDGNSDVTDDMLLEVRNFAKYILERKMKKP